MLLWMPLLAACHAYEVVPDEVFVTPRARPLQVGFAAPSPTCQSLGPVVGATRSAGYTTPDQHIAHAMDDARNKAAALGANYLQTQPPQLDTSPLVGAVGATVTGLAYLCPSGTPEATAYESANQQPSVSKR